MNLENVSAVIRPRNRWEAIDLGCKLVRAEYPKLLLACAAILAPIYVVAQLALLSHPVWVGMIVWWLKPIWERPALYILSRSLFGDSPSLSETIREFPRYGFRQALLWLTWLRLSPTRSFQLPVTLLEGLSGSARSQRAELLQRRGSGSAASWLTVVGVHLESFILFAIMILAQLLLPESSDFNLLGWFMGLDTTDEGPLYLQQLLLVAAVLVVAPFYVGSGFALYINRRTQLEGWDLEIVFRQLADRIEESSRRNPRNATAAMLLCGLLTVAQLVAAPTTSHASSGQLDRESAREAIRTVLAGEEFHDPDTVWIPTFDWQDCEGEECNEKSWLRRLIEWLLERMRVEGDTSLPIAWMGEVLEAALIALAAGVLAYVLYRHRERLARAARWRPDLESRPPPGVLLGMDVTPESLPEDVVTSVLSLWREGQHRAAYSLLYRATLTELMSRHSVEFRESFTERDCVRATARVVGDGCARFFEELTHHWQLLAYRHEDPSDAVVESLCASWPRYFGAREPTAMAREAYVS